MNERHIVIAGAGQAGTQAAMSLRQGGFEGRISLVSQEDRLPYQRPPLSKGYLKEELPFRRLLLRPENFYRANRIDLLQGETVTAVDRRDGRVALASGSSLAFDRLVLATGASNRVLPVPGVDLEGVCMLRTVNEADRLRNALSKASHIVVVGGGFIGLEVAASARALGAEVTVLEATGRLMSRAVSPTISEYLLHAHRAMGTRIELGVQASRIAGAKSAEAVETAAGDRYRCDLVVVAIGIVRSVALVEQAELATANGIVVDRFLATSDPRIFAIGDCAAFPTPFAAGPVRLESVQNAVDQAKCVAARILGGEEAYAAVPWFWSDQADEKLQIAGMTCPADHVHSIGSAEDGEVAAYCFREGRFVGVEAVNRPSVYVASRKLLTHGGATTYDDLERVNFDLAECLRRAGGQPHRPQPQPGSHENRREALPPAHQNEKEESSS